MLLLLVFVDAVLLALLLLLLLLPLPPHGLLHHAIMVQGQPRGVVSHGQQFRGYCSTTMIMEKGSHINELCM